MLKRGMIGWRVTELQRLLNRHYESSDFMPLGETGEYGVDTENLVTLYQEQNGMEVTGVAGIMLIMSLRQPDIYKKLLRDNGHWWSRW